MWLKEHAAKLLSAHVCGVGVTWQPAALLLAAAGAAVLAVVPAAAAVEAHATPGGPGMIAVADVNADRVQVFHHNGTFAFSIETAGAAPLRGTTDVAVGPDGRIYVADYGTDRVQVFHHNGTFAFPVWSGEDRDFYPSYIAVGPGGRIAVIEFPVPTRSGSPPDFVRIYHPNGTFAFALGSDGFIGYPVGIAVGPDGRIYVGDPDGNHVQVFQPDGTPAPGISVNDSGSRLSSTLAVGPDGRVYAATTSFLGVRLISVFHPNGTFESSIGLPGMRHVSGVAAGPDGRIVVTDGRYTGGDLMNVFHPNGTLAFTFGPHERVQRVLSHPTTVAVGPDGRVYAAAYDTDPVQVFHPNGTFAFALGPDGPDPEYFESPSAVAVGPDPEYFESPSAVAVGPNGRIYVAEDGGYARGGPYNYSVHVFHPNGTPASSFARDGFLADDGRVAVGPDGRVAVIEETVPRPSRDFVQLFHPNGTPALSIWPGNNITGSLHDIDIGPDGRIYVAEDDGSYNVHGYHANYSVRVYHPNGTFAFAFPLHTGMSSNSPSIAVGPDGRVYGVHVEHPSRGSNAVPGSVQVYHPNGTFESSFGPSDHGDGVFYEPLAVDVGPDGRVYVGESTDSGGYVLVFDPDGTPALAMGGVWISPGALNGPSGVAVGPGLPPILDRICAPDTPLSHCSIHAADPGPPPAGPPAPLVAVIGQPLFTGGAGGVPHNFTNVGDLANVSIDVGGLANPGAPPLNGSETSTVTFPATETVVTASFATVSFPPNVTATHVPAGGLLALHVSANVPDDGLVLEALAPNGSGAVVLRRVVEVGGQNSSVVFDRPVRILLEGQAGGRAFYIAGANGMITPVDEACVADGAAEVHAQLGGSGECQMDSVSGGKIVYTYHLTRFGTAEIVPAPAPAAPPSAPPVVHTCSVSLGSANLDLRATAGGYSDPVRQALRNTGSLALEHVELGATTWKDVSPLPAPAPAPSLPPPVVGTDAGRTSAVLMAVLVAGLPASVTELSTDARGTAPYAPLANGTAVAHGLEDGDEELIWFRMNLSDRGGLQGGTFVQTITYQAQCASP